MNQREKYLKALAAEVGYREEEGKTKFGQSYADRHGDQSFAPAPWCVMYLTETARKLGIPTDIIPDTASCRTMLNWAEGNGLRIGDIPAQRGDLVLYDWNPAAADGVEHIGIVDSVDGDNPDTQILHLLEGNWGDAVARTTYRYRDVRVYAIIRPPYDMAETPEQEETVVNVALRQLQEGDSGLDVGVVQQLLLLYGYDPSYVDCIFGEKTKAAVLKFQWGVNLAADGIVGEKTWTALLGG